MNNDYELMYTSYKAREWFEGQHWAVLLPVEACMLIHAYGAESRWSRSEAQTVHRIAQSARWCISSSPSESASALWTSMCKIHCDVFVTLLSIAISTALHVNSPQRCPAPIRPSPSVCAIPSDSRKSEQFNDMYARNKIPLHMWFLFRLQNTISLDLMF